MHPVVRRFWTILCLVAMVGCSGGPPDDSSATDPQIVPSALSQPTWRPKQPIAPVQMTDAEKQQRRTAGLDTMREGYGLPPMDYPDLVRWIYPEQLASVMVPCLEQKGFAATAGANGRSYKAAPGEAQLSAFSLAEVECSAMYSVDPRLTGEPSDAQKNLIYDYWIESMIPCLGEHGISVQPPSREVFITTPQPLEGYPFGTEIELACPYSAPSQALLGVNY